MPLKPLLLTFFFSFTLFSIGLNASLFQENKGQWPADIAFRISDPGHQVSFGLHQVHTALQSPNSEGYFAYTTHFLGASAHTQLTGEVPSSAEIHYFQGQAASFSPETYCALRYRELYPGIEATYYLLDGQLKYDLLVEPFASPNLITLQYEGIDQLSIGEQGQLWLHTSAGVFEEAPPVSYQFIEGQKVVVPTVYELTPEGLLTYVFPQEYDPSRELIIDPVVLEWGTYLGGAALNLGGTLEDFTVDEDGYIYGTGAYLDGFPTTTGIWNPLYNGGSSTGPGTVLAGDAVIFKLDPTGSQLIWATYLGGTRGDVGKAIQLGTDGKIYVMGWTDSEDFPVTPGVFQDSAGGFWSEDVFVAKLSPDGSQLEYATYFGGGGGDYGGDMAINAAGEVFVSGHTNGGQIPTTPGAFDETFNGAVGFADAFVFRLSADASQLIYSTFIGGSESETGEAIVINANDEAFVTGENSSPDFPTTPGAFQTVRYGINSSAFALRLSADGSRLIYSTYVGGSRGDYGEAIALKANGNAIITGRTASFDWPTTTGAWDTTWNGDFDVFLTQVAPDGTQLISSTYLGEQGREIGTSLALNRNEEIFLAGNTNSSNFPLTECAWDTSFNGGGGSFWGGDIFLAKFDPTGNQLMYNTFLGGQGEDMRGILALDERNCSTEVIVGTTTRSSDFPATPGSAQDTASQGENLFALAKFREEISFSLSIDPDSCPQPGDTLTFSSLVDSCGNWTQPNSWQWSFGDGNRGAGQEASHAYTEPGTYTVGLHYAGCALPVLDTTVRLLEIHLGPDQQICAGESVLLNGSHPDAVSYEWEDGITEPIREVTEDGTYGLTITDSVGCEASDRVQVAVVGEDLLLPNVFTPNGDQVNDAFFIKGLGSLEWDLQVFNRWGKAVFQTEVYQNNWQGDNLQSGVYYYILTEAEGCGQYVGWVSLLR